MDSIKKTARLAGLLYLLASLFGPFSLIYVPGKIMVRGDATATANHLRAYENLLRLGIGADLVGFTAFIYIALVLYRLFKPVNATTALTMLVLFLVSIPITFLNELNDIAALYFAGGRSAAGYLSAFDANQRDALAYLFLDLHGDGIIVSQIFWGLWLFPFGVLVIRSGFIPRLLGILLIIAGIGNVAGASCALVLPQYAHGVNQVTGFLGLGELPIILWLLIWGAKPQRQT